MPTPQLHELGWAHSVETFRDGELVGGLYGVRINGFFAGESMFHTAPDASKVALVHLVRWLVATGATLLDVQWTTPHLVSLGAIDVRRDEYLTLLARAVETRRQARARGRRRRSLPSRDQTFATGYSEPANQDGDSTSTALILGVGGPPPADTEIPADRCP